MSNRSIDSMKAFTVLELLVVITISGLLIGVAWPGLKQLSNSYERQNTQSTLEFDLRRARAEALSRGARVIMTIAADGNSYTLGEDDLPYDTTSAVPDSIFGTSRLPSGNTLTLNSGTQIIFNSRGFLSDISGTPRTTTLTVTLSIDGTAYSTATIYPVGVAKFTLVS